MSRKTMLWLFVLGLAPLGSAAQTGPALTADFTLTVTSTGRGSHEVVGHYARSRDGKIREETPAFVTITDPKARTVTILNPATKEATVIQGIRRKTQADREAAFPARLETEMGGTAVPSRSQLADKAAVEGHPIAKKQSAARDGGTREIWTATDISLPVFIKTSSSARSSTKALRNIALREPDSSLFEIPKDYKVTTKTDNGSCPLPECRTGPTAGLSHTP